MTRTGAAIAALVLCAGLSTHLSAQQVDSTPRFSLFGGFASDDYHGNGSFGSHNFDFGGSGDFRIRAFPLQLRATLAFSQQHLDSYLNDRKTGVFSIDAVGHPLPSLFGMRPYILGGLGAATQAPFRTAGVFPDYDGTQRFYQTNSPRTTWTFVEGGVGLELGHHLFVQSKLQLPVASDGPSRAPLSLGIRF